MRPKNGEINAHSLQEDEERKRRLQETGEGERARDCAETQVEKALEAFTEDMDTDTETFFSFQEVERARGQAASGSLYYTCSLASLLNSLIPWRKGPRPIAVTPYWNDFVKTVRSTHSISMGHKAALFYWISGPLCSCIPLRCCSHGDRRSDG